MRFAKVALTLWRAGESHRQDHGRRDPVARVGNEQHAQPAVRKARPKADALVVAKRQDRAAARRKLDLLRACRDSRALHMRSFHVVDVEGKACRGRSPQAILPAEAQFALQHKQRTIRQRTQSRNAAASPASIVEWLAPGVGRVWALARKREIPIKPRGRSFRCPCQDSPYSSPYFFFR